MDVSTNLLINNNNNSGNLNSYMITNLRFFTKHSTQVTYCVQVKNRGNSSTENLLNICNLHLKKGEKDLARQNAVKVVQVGTKNCQQSGNIQWMIISILPLVLGKFWRISVSKP